MIDNRDSKKRYRADVLIEDQLAKYDALAAKNAILIVEFARDYHASGKSITEAALEGTEYRR